MKGVYSMGKFKKGAASFYMVAIATLVLVIIATSFAAIIIAEIARTSNDDLAQSAYDAAMAGVEDARLAYYNYNNCINNGGSEGSCADSYLGNDNGCNSFVDNLGRFQEENGEVKIQESQDNNNNMDQAYTCVKISKPNKVVGVLDGDNPTKVMQINLDEGESAAAIKTVGLSWKRKVSDSDNSSTSETTGLPMMELSLTQTGGSDFKMEDFEKTVDGKTNRGTVFLEPVFGKEEFNEPTTTGWFAKSNDKVALNEPYKINCSLDNEYWCSVDIELPEPIGGTRSDKTLMFALSMMGEDTDKVEWGMVLCKEGGTGGENCYDAITSDEDGTNTTTSDDGKLVKLNMQIAVDATGRANDLYRRVEVILEKDAGQNDGIYAVAVKDLYKIPTALCEQNFDGKTNCDD